MNIGDIEIVSIPVTDQQAAKQFYRDVLGFVLLVENEFAPGQVWIQLAPYEGAKTTISLVTWFDDMPSGAINGLILKVDAIEPAVETLHGKGLSVAAIQDTPWGRFATFKDPDGNGWTLHEASGAGETGKQG